MENLWFWNYYTDQWKKHPEILAVLLLLLERTSSDQATIPFVLKNTNKGKITYFR